MTDLTQKSLNRILEVFTGEDGGIGFAKFRAWLDTVDKGTEPADKELTLLVVRFAKLLDLVAK